MSMSATGPSFSGYFSSDHLCFSETEHREREISHITYILLHPKNNTADHFTPSKEVENNTKILWEQWTVLFVLELT